MAQVRKTKVRTARKGEKKFPQKPARTVKKPLGKAVKARPRRKAGQERPVAQKAPVPARGDAQKILAGKEALIKKLQKDLTLMERAIEEGEVALQKVKKAADKTISALKKKGEDDLRVLRDRAEAEVQKLREELTACNEKLRGKTYQLEECREGAESKISWLEAKVREYEARKAVIEERTGNVTSRGNPLTLLGPELKEGDQAPDFDLLDPQMNPVTLENFQGKVKIISSVVSVDTPLCSMETRRFNEEAGKLPEGVALLTISMDLPFALRRWCAAEGVEKVKTFSDYREHSFGLNYGVLIKETGLLARAVFIVDDQNILRYVELVSDTTQEPDYDGVLNAVRELL